MPAPETSLSLLERAGQKDPEAWRRLVNLYTGLIAYWCRRGGLSGEDVDDVVQEVFKAVSTHLGNFQRGAHSFRAWMRGITRHKILDHFQSRRNQPAPVGGSEAYIWLQQVAESNSDLPDEEDQLRALHHRGLELVRGEFEERTWQAFWRTVVDSQATQDVAKELGMSPGAVRVAKSRVLHRLREELGELID
jgi:RNA polymerase sigma-70 factor (ECF subfamily)